MNRAARAADDQFEDAYAIADARRRQAERGLKMADDLRDSYKANALLADRLHNLKTIAAQLCADAWLTDNGYRVHRDQLMALVDALGLSKQVTMGAPAEMVQA